MQIFIDTHPETKTAKDYGNAYNRAFRSIFCNSPQQYQERITGGMFPETAIDAKVFLEDYFKIDLTI